MSETRDSRAIRPLQQFEWYWQQIRFLCALNESGGLRGGDEDKLAAGGSHDWTLRLPDRWLLVLRAANFCPFRVCFVMACFCSWWYLENVSVWALFVHFWVRRVLSRMLFTCWLWLLVFRNWMLLYTRIRFVVMPLFAMISRKFVVFGPYFIYFWVGRYFLEYCLPVDWSFRTGYFCVLGFVLLSCSCLQKICHFGPLFHIFLRRKVLSRMSFTCWLSWYCFSFDISDIASCFSSFSVFVLISCCSKIMFMWWCHQILDDLTLVILKWLLHV